MGGRREGGEGERVPVETVGAVEEFEVEGDRGLAVEFLRVGGH